MTSQSRLSTSAVRDAFDRAARLATTLTPVRRVGLLRLVNEEWHVIAGDGIDCGRTVSEESAAVLPSHGPTVVCDLAETDPVRAALCPTARSVAGCPIDPGPAETVLFVTSPEREAFGTTFTDALEELAGVIEDAMATADVERAQSRHYEFLENIPVGVYRSTPDGRILYANSPLANLFGVASVDELKDVDLNDTGVAQEDRSAFKKRVEREGKIVQSETSWTRADGRQVDVLESARVVRDDSGAVKYYEGVVEDITERKRTERELRTEKHFIHSALSSLPGIFYLIDREFRFRRWNRQLEDVTGYTADEIEELSPLDLVADKDRDRVAQRIRTVFDQGEAAVEAMVESKQGHAVPFYLTGARAEIRGAPFLVGMGIDISERVAVEEALMEAKQEAEEMNRLKTVFLANMSHEIRTPLTSILGFTDVLEEEVDGGAKRVVDMIRESGHRLKETLTSVLELARLERESRTVGTERCNLVDRVSETVQLMEPQIESKGLTLDLRVPSSSLHVRADPRVLHRVLTNLVSNAIKFTEDGTIRVEVERRNGEAILEVSDTGIGISDEFLDQVFDEFRQESEGLTRAHDGSGLGLTITQRLVELMGGSIQASSTKGEGSTFTVRLPSDEHEEASSESPE